MGEGLAIQFRGIHPNVIFPAISVTFCIRQTPSVIYMNQAYRMNIYGNITDLRQQCLAAYIHTYYFVPQPKLYQDVYAFGPPVRASVIRHFWKVDCRESTT